MQVVTPDCPVVRHCWMLLHTATGPHLALHLHCLLLYCNLLKTSFHTMTAIKYKQGNITFLMPDKADKSQYSETSYKQGEYTGGQAKFATANHSKAYQATTNHIKQMLSL